MLVLLSHNGLNSLIQAFCHDIHRACERLNLLGSHHGQAVLQIPFGIAVSASTEQLQRPDRAADNQPTGRRRERHGEQTQSGDLPVQRANGLGRRVERQGRASDCHGTLLRT